MNRTFKTAASVISITLLTACGKQPTEMQKAQIEKQILGCLTAVTTQIGAEEENIFTSLNSLSSKIGSVEDMSKPKWKITGKNSEIVNMTLILTGTKYSCNYVQEQNNPEYQLVEVQRNKEVVFSLSDDEAARAENEKLAEQKKVEDERKKELARAEKIKKWVEKSYSNVSYKYYEKRHIADIDNNYSSPKLRITCNPKRKKFELDRFSISNEIQNHPFTFLIDGKKVEKKYDLTDQGAIGVYNPDNWINKVSWSQNKQDEFMNLFVKSEAIFVDGYEYHVDDLSTVPCMK